MTVIDPRDIDWSNVSDLEVYLSAESGLPEAIEEAHRRGLRPEVGRK